MSLAKQVKCIFCPRRPRQVRMIIADQAGQPFKPGPYSVSEDASLGGIEVKGGKGIQLDVSKILTDTKPGPDYDRTHYWNRYI